MIGEYNKSVVLTYLGIAVSLIGIYTALINKIQYSVVCLMISGICDLFDGKVARMCKRNERQKQFGVQIDSLADTVSFLALPAVIGMQLTCSNINVSVFCYVLYVLAGVIRLAWFNITADSNEPKKYYEGLPVTYIALILPTFLIIIKTINILYGEIISAYIYSVIVAIIYLITGLFFVLNIKLKKPTGVWYIFFSCLAVIEIYLVLKNGI